MKYSGPPNFINIHQLAGIMAQKKDIDYWAYTGYWGTT